MSFLNNNGDTILDAVLTDAGRARLARGDGSFRIVKFALGDDEIDYSLWNGNHVSGSAYYDIDILSTPVFEALTDNAASMKSKLVSISRNNILYLPVIKAATAYGPGAAYTSDNNYYMLVDDNTSTVYKNNNSPVGSLGAGVIDGSVAGAAASRPIVFQQGLDTSEISYKVQIPSDLNETQYLIEIDSRFGEIVNPKTGKTASVTAIDDDYIATYFVSTAITPDMVKQIGEVGTDSAIAGPRGTELRFSIKSSLDLNTSTYLFSLVGTTQTINTQSYLTIDDTVRVIGATTGYSVDVPIRYLKKS